MSESGLAQLFMTMRPALMRFLLARGVPHGDAEDVLQDLFIKATGVAGPIAEPKAYLYRMADNLVLDRSRSAVRRKDRERAWVESRSGDRLDVDDAPTPERAMIARDRMAEVLQTLQSLPQRTAQALRLYRVEGCSQQQIADQMGISLSAVEKHLQRAYRSMRDCRARLDAETENLQRLNDQGGNKVADGG